MKKFLKSNIFAFIIGGIVFGGIGVGATLLYNSNEILYTPTDSSFNVSNVKEALDELYRNSSNTQLTLVAENFTAPNGSYEVYTSNTINIKDFLENNNINKDYSKLTIDDFILIVAGASFESNVRITSPKFAPEISDYNPTTGILTIGKISYAWNQQTNNGFSLVKYYVNVYMK